MKNFKCSCQNKLEKKAIKHMKNIKQKLLINAKLRFGASQCELLLKIS